MNSAARRIAFAILPFLGLASSASAQSKSWSSCGGNIFNTCASVDLAISGNTVTVRVQNYSGKAGTNTFAGTIFTGIGFDNLALSAVYNLKQGKKFVAGSTTMSGPRIGGSYPAPSPWIAQNNTQIGGGINLDLVGSTSTGVKDGIASDCAQAGQLPGANNGFWASYSGCAGGYTIADQGLNSGWVVFSFSVGANTVTQADLNNVTLLVKGQNGVNGQSTEFVCLPGECELTTTQVTPEPVTVVLLGTGLFGIALVGRRRKAKQSDA